MSAKVFQDKIFPRHISDMMNLMHMMIYQGTDGEEKWESILTLQQKEYVSLALAQYYQCQHCIDHHMTALCRVEKLNKSTLSKNVNSLVLFLRIDSRQISASEKEQWTQSWQRFSYRICTESKDDGLAYLIGFAIGIARNDDFLLNFCGNEVLKYCKTHQFDARIVAGELEAVVIFMKAAASKNRVAEKLEVLLQGE